MAAGTKVQLRLGDRVVAEVAFRDGALRIGRMKENDLVINNLAVSRFHAVLRRVGEGYEIEDLGSENGTHVAGVQVRGTAPVSAGAQIGIGKHVLTILVGGAGDGPVQRVAKSDAWDAAQTYFAPELAPRGNAASAPAIGAAPVSAAEADEGEALLEADAFEEPAARPLATSLDLPDPEGRFAFGEDELLVAEPLQAVAIEAAAAEFDISASESDGSAPPASLELARDPLFDFGASSNLGLSEESLARAAAARASAALVPAALYAGLIVQRGGRVERVVPVDGAELIVGRAPGCGLVLSTAGISRRHVRFVREAESLRVFDLDSINGMRVNGERVTERLLQLGDVVAIDEYELTFVLDREPLDQAIRSAGVAASASAGPQRTLLHAALPASMPERDLVTESDEEDLAPDLEKELEIAAVLRTSAVAVPSQSAELDWVVELVVGAEGLPPALRALLRELGEQPLPVPVELRIRRR